MSRKQSSLDTRIFDLLDKSNAPLPVSEIQNLLDDVEPSAIVGTINVLNKRCLVDLFQDNGELVVSRRSHEEAEKLRSLTDDEKLVYTHISRSGNMGIWTRDLRSATGFQLPQLTKLLKILQNRKLIKSVKSVLSKSKKVFMLFELEPSVQHTGGPLYDDNQNFDYNFVDNLLKIITTIVKRRV
ncbi:hypothetical protein GEMRC1_001973 [Eukaryota sp. GEM-RC1]